MATNDATKVNGKELTTWKDIAEYLGVTVRTAQRWEEERGLPVQRYPGAKGRITTSTEALDRWKLDTLRTSRWWSSPQFLKASALTAGTIALVTATILLVWYVFNRHGEPALFQFEASLLTVSDASGKPIWRRYMDPPLDMVSYRPETGRPMLQFNDVDDDGHVETLFNYEPVNRNGTALICYSDTGVEKWRFKPGRTIQYRGGTLTPDYMVSTFAVTRVGKEKEKRILTTNHHAVWWSNQFAVLDSRGRLLTEYWHSGRLIRMALADVDGNGIDEVLLAGMNNGYQGVTLVVLDPRSAHGASEQAPDDPFQILGFQDGNERARIVLPRTCINKAFQPYNIVDSLSVVGDTIRLITIERQTVPGSQVIYTFDTALRLIDCIWGDRLKALHRELEIQGALDHSLTEAEMQESRKIRVLRYLNAP